MADARQSGRRLAPHHAAWHRRRLRRGLALRLGRIWFSNRHQSWKYYYFCGWCIDCVVPLLKIALTISRLCFASPFLLARCYMITLGKLSILMLLSTTVWALSLSDISNTDATS